MAVENINIERAVLSSFLFNPGLFSDHCSSVQPSDFYLPAHSKIFEAMKSLEDNDIPIDEEFIKKELDKNKAFNEKVMLEVLSTNPISPIEPYLNELREKAAYRTLLKITNDIKVSVSEQITVHEIVDTTSNSLDEITDNNIGVNVKNLKDFVKTFKDELINAQNSTDGITGIRTGIDTLDNKTGGFEPGELVVIAGRPGMGKTACGTTIANYCDNAGIGVLFDSLEMDGSKIVRRIIANRADENLGNLKRGLFENYEKATEAIKELEHSNNLLLHSINYPSIEQLCAKASKVFRKNRHVKIWIIDHLKHIKKKSTASYEISNEIAEQLKQIIRVSKDHGVVPIVLHQLSRANESRQNKRPALSDLGQSSSIEELASWVIFPYRASYYERLDTGAPEPFVSDAEIIIAKARDGEGGVCTCFFCGRYSRFQNDKPASYKVVEYQEEKKSDFGGTI